ncbi:hypothetical protein KC349_g7614 [Hortaea werneckii]|nr:hypothetical protein KC349_g7614 [Hortaea werneckii]
MRGLFIMLVGFLALVSGHAVGRGSLNPESIENISFPATPTVFSDGIVVTHERDPNPSAKHCIDSNRPAVGEPRICTCYANSKAISYDRAILRKAIDQFCKAISKYTFGGPSNWWWSIWLPYREFDTCGELHLDYETCFSAFHAPFDSCDIFAENGKYGGRAYDPCFEYTVDPNPGIHNPDLAIPPMV